MTIALIVLGLMVLVLLALVLRRPATPGADQSSLMLKQDLSRLSDDILSLKNGLQTQLGDRFEKNQAMMMGSLQRQFSESTKLITEVT
ncbi:hypothetical protein H7Y63_00590, partial [Polaromonas sp.]|nr:hypothetical protein [Candidatus Saccharibacteria bacterium]